MPPAFDLRLGGNTWDSVFAQARDAHLVTFLTTLTKIVDREEGLPSLTGWCRTFHHGGSVKQLGLTLRWQELMTGSIKYMDRQIRR